MSKKSKYIVDEIIHKFDSNENSYFSFGSITGEIDANGKDILEPTVTLVIPKSKIPVLFDQFKTAINYKEKEIIISEGRTKAFIDSKYEILTNDISLDKNLNILTSDQKTVIIDDENTQYETDILNYSINRKILDGTFDVKCIKSGSTRLWNPEHIISWWNTQELVSPAGK